MFNQLIFTFALVLATSMASAHLSSFKNYTDPVDGRGLHGWYGELEELKYQLDPNKNYAIAIVHRPVNGFLFQNIYWFRSSVLAARKQLKQNSHGQLGHFQVAWSCKLPGQKKRHYGLTGQTGERSYQGLKMLTKLGYGMSIFFANYTDGYLQSSAGSAQRIRTSPGAYGFSWVAFEISGQDCERGLTYLNEYIRVGAYRNFSFVKDPRRLHGGGCTSFASELLHRFGALSRSLVDAWKTKFEIPWYFVANPGGLPRNTELPAWLNDPKFRENRTDFFQIGVLPVLSRRATNLVADIYDTEKILFSIDSMLRRATSTYPQYAPRGFRPPYRRAKGLKWENRVKASNARDSVPINAKLHDGFGRLHRYIYNSRIQTPAFEYMELNGQPGLVFERAAW